MKRFIVSTTGLLLLLVAQTTAAQGPPPAKRALIRELLAVMGARQNAGKTVNSILTEMSRQYPKMIESLADADPDLTPAQRQRIKTETSESYARFSKAFQERFNQRIDLGQVIEEISYSLYDKHFTEDEIKDLISFYKTATGRKSLAVMPELFAESIQKTNEKLSPVLTPLIMEIITEEKDRIKRSK